MQLVFDLDDTLIATREAKLQAYWEQVPGLKESVVPPSNFHEISWERWATKEQHQQMQMRLSRWLMWRSHELPAMRLLMAAGGMILTSCSPGSLGLLTTRWPQLHRFPIVRVDNAYEKLQWLKDNEPTHGGIYFDNDHDLLERVREETKWQTIRA